MSAAETTDIKLLQLNMFLRPPVVLLQEYRDARAHRLLEENLPTFDILTLQECFGFWTSRRQRMIKAAKQQGYYSTYTKLEGRAKSLFKGQLKFVDAGLLILSKFPIERSMFVSFKNGSASDRLAMKGVLYALLDLNREDGKKVHLFTTHTQASYTYKPSQTSVKIRIAQVKELEAFIRETTAKSSSSWPVVLTGDFNMDALQECEEYEQTMASLERCTREGDDGEKSSFRDVVKDKYGKHVPTATPYEFSAATGAEVRSSFQRRDYEDLLQVVKDSGKELSKTSRNYYETGQTFWTDQRLDYVFVEQTKTTRIDDADVEPFLYQGEPYSHLSDHFGITASFLRALNKP